MNTILFALSMCVASTCEVDYHIISFPGSNAFCLEKEEVCCDEVMCKYTSTLACYPNKIFVGNFESL